MANPLFAPQPPRPPKRPEPWRWIDPAEKAFSVVVAAGWTADGGLRRFERGQKYVVFTLTGPDGAIVFWGDPDLPLRHFVPGPWHVGQGLVPGKRAWFGQGNDAQALYPSPYVPADRLAHALTTRRFGVCVPGATNPDPSQVETIRSATAGAGAPVQRIDACIARFSTADRRREGCLHLSTFGGDQPGDTWQADFVSGWFGPAASAKETEAAYDLAAGSLSTDPKWAAGEPTDEEKARRTSQATAAAVRKIDASDLVRESRDRDRSDEAAKLVADIIKRKLPRATEL